jgi:hypothetical protein
MTMLGRRSIWVMTLALGFGPAAVGLGMEVPASLSLNTLAQYYEGVAFDHALHLDVTSDCAVCHHHTTGTPVQEGSCSKCHPGGEARAKVACSDCHPREPFAAGFLQAKKVDSQRYHNDQLGLKGAYHQNCLGCHRQMDGPTGCQDCHALNQQGEALMRTGGFTPKTTAAKGH